MSRDCRWVSVEIEGERVRAAIPPPLPPDPPLALTPRLFNLAMEAQSRLSELSGATAVLPSTEVFLWSYVRKEALLSAQIEGTRGSLSDLLFYELDEAPGAPLDDIREVSNYVRAMDHARDWLATRPIGLRLLKEMHFILLQSGRGASKAPGEYRRAPVWVQGGRPSSAEFVPPPWDEVPVCMDALEKWINAEDDLPVLLKAGLAHVQFETIHPFLDGNGRLGRALITLMLMDAKILRAPTLYLSLYFKANRDRYFQLLNEVRRRGAWEEWLEFFLVGVRDTAGPAAATAQRLLDLFDRDRQSIDRATRYGRQITSIQRVFQAIQRRAIFKSTSVTADVSLTQPAVDSAIRALVELGIVSEVTGRKRNRIWRYGALMAVLDEGTEQLA